MATLSYKTGFILVCILQQHTCCALPPIPAAIKNAASVTATTVNHCPEETKQALITGEVPRSSTYLYASFVAAALTTKLTNRLFQSTRVYHVLDKTARGFAKRSTGLPRWAHRRIMPALSLGASTAFSTVCFMALYAPARIVESGITESFEELEHEEALRKKAP